MDCFIGLDMGTSAVKGVVVTENGTILSSSLGKFRYFEKNNEKRLNPKEFLDVCFCVIKDLCSNLDKGNEVKAICSCCAAGSLVFLGETLEPLTDIIGWQTAVDEDIYETLYSEEEKTEVYKTVGWPVLNGFPVAYLPYTKVKNQELLEGTRKLCMTAEYLNFALTGKWGISQSMGTPFYLMDQEKGVYNPKMLSRLGIKEEILPPIFNKGTVIGKISEDVAVELGLSADVKVVLGSFDHPSAATGAGVYKEGEMLLSCGTSWVEFFPVRSREMAIDTEFLVDRFMLVGAPYCVMSSLTSFSEKIDDFRKHYFGKISHKEFDEFLKGSTLGCNGLKFDLFCEEYPDCKNYSKSDIARAIIEAAANKLSENLEIARKKGLLCEKITMVGGITNSLVCVNVIAETIGKEIVVANGESAGAVGAAMLAAIGIGKFENEEEAFKVFNS